jgi:antitoxin YefM
VPVDIISLNTFKESLKEYVEQITQQHAPMKVTNHQGQDFVVISLEDWEREQETLYILQNNSLIQQIADSTTTHTQQQGYRPSNPEIDEILSL